MQKFRAIRNLLALSSMIVFLFHASSASAAQQSIPSDVDIYLKHMQQCYELAGEINGDGNLVDKKVQNEMAKEKCSEDDDCHYLVLLEKYKGQPNVTKILQAKYNDIIDDPMTVIANRCKADTGQKQLGKLPQDVSAFLDRYGQCFLANDAGDTIVKTPELDRRNAKLKCGQEGCDYIALLSKYKYQPYILKTLKGRTADESLVDMCPDHTR